MELKTLRESDIEEEEKAIEQYLRNLPDLSRKRDALKLMGLEIFALIGAKVVLPILSGLISRVLYDQYNSIQTRRKANAAKRAIMEHKGKSEDVVDDETIIQDVTKSLTSEGIPEAEAKKVVVSTLERMKGRLASSNAT